MQPVRGVMLDIDGTLVASNDAHAHAWVEALAEQAIQVPFERVRKLIGMGGDKLFPAVTSLRPDSPQGAAISRRRAEIFKERYLPQLRPTPGAYELVRHLKERGLRLGVASSAKKDELHALLEVCGIAALIESKTSTDDAEHSKPDPDIVQAALAKLGMPPTAAVLLGDTPYDVAAGERAGVAVIAVRCGGWGDADLAGARALYDDPADLLAQYETSLLSARAA